MFPKCCPLDLSKFIDGRFGGIRGVSQDVGEFRVTCYDGFTIVVRFTNLVSAHRGLGVMVTAYSVYTTTVYLDLPLS